jgi:hypothetical protein
LIFITLALLYLVGTGIGITLSQSKRAGTAQGKTEAGKWKKVIVLKFSALMT